MIRQLQLLRSGLSGVMPLATLAAGASLLSLLILLPE
jgi:hypothetical protein